MEAYGSTHSEDIIKAVKGVIEEANSGVHPNEAFVRIVKSGKYEPEITKRMIEAFNQSRAVRQLEEPIEKRAEHFDIADPQAIFGSVYSGFDNEMSSNNNYIDDTESHNFLDQKPDIKIITYKSAALDYPVSDITLTKSASKEAASINKLEKEARAAEAIYTNTMTDMVKAASEQMRKVSHESYDDFERRVQRAYGESGNKLVNLVYKFANITRPITAYKKQATFMLPARSPYIEIAKAMDAADKLTAAREKVASLRSGEDAELRLLRKTANLGAVYNYVKPEYKSMGPSVTIRPEDKDIRAEMSAIDLKSTISDMMMYDPEISAYPLADVIKATNNAVSIAPNAMKNPATLRAAIHRTLVDHNMSIDEALQLAQSENDLNSGRVQSFTTQQQALGRIPLKGATKDE